MRFLDVAAIRPGDILVTAERQLRSKVIRIGQRLLHPQHFKTAGYSHAMVVVAPGIVFESTSEGGLRFNFLDYAVRQQGKHLVLAADVSKYERLHVLRLKRISDAREGDDAISERLVEACLMQNLKAYPRKRRFASLLACLPSRVVTRATRLSRKAQDKEFIAEGWFCSAVVVDVLQCVGKLPLGVQVHSGTVSPLKLAASTALAPVLCDARGTEALDIEYGVRNIMWQMKCAVPKHTIRSCQQGIEWFSIAHTALVRFSALAARVEDGVALASTGADAEAIRGAFDRPLPANVPRSDEIRFPLQLHALAINGLLDELKSLNMCFDACTCTPCCTSAATCAKHTDRLLGARDRKAYYWDYVWTYARAYDARVLERMRQDS